MDMLSKENLSILLGEHHSPCISIFFPTFRKGAEAEQNSIRFKNLLRYTEKTLAEKGYRSSQIRELLDEPSKLNGDHNFWNYQSDGAAFFIAKNEFYYFRLPRQFEESVMINDRFYVKPLLPLFNNNSQFYILSLDQKKMRLFSATKYTITGIELKDVITNLDDYIKVYNNTFQQEQYSRAERGGGPMQGFYNGPSAGTNDARQNRDLLKFFQLFNKGVTGILRKTNSPLILAGVEFLIPLYREANTYANLIDESVKLNTDYMSEQELHGHAWKIAEEHFNLARQNHVFQFEQLYDTERTSDILREIVTAAFSRRVAVLFFNPKISIWGRFNSVDFTVDIHSVRMPGDEDLLNLASVQTLAYDGVVYALNEEEMPTTEPAAAIFRF
ncbi:MAG: hypothetical protein ACM3SM_13430 [Bacteroidota bacterium]